MKNPSRTRAMLAGFIATSAMIFLSIIARHMAIPVFSWAKAFTTYLGGNLLTGYFIFFIAGVSLALVYVRFFYDRLPGYSWKRGVSFAVLMWILTGVLFAPLMHLGFFMDSVPLALSTLVSYSLYGAVLGYIYDA